MEQYIPKSVLVAEIERRIESCAKQRKEMLNVQCHTLADDASARMGELTCIKDFLDTLEVKEVDLDKEIETYWNKISKADAKLGTKSVIDIKKFIAIAIHFANWQKQQFEKNRLKHCNNITNEQAKLEQEFIDQHIDKHQRMPTFLDAIEYGVKWKEQQMMKEAVDGLVVCDELTHGYKDIAMHIPDNLVVGDKVKLIIIKED